MPNVNANMEGIGLIARFLMFNSINKNNVKNISNINIIIIPNIFFIMNVILNLLY